MLGTSTLMMGKECLWCSSKRRVFVLAEFQKCQHTPDSSPGSHSRSLGEAVEELLSFVEEIGESLRLWRGSYRLVLWGCSAWHDTPAYSLQQQRLARRRCQQWPQRPRQQEPSWWPCLDGCNSQGSLAIRLHLVITCEHHWMFLCIWIHICMCSYTVGPVITEFR